MTKDETIRTACQNFAGLTDLIGAGEAIRYYPLVVPQTDGGAELPAVVYQRIAESRFLTLEDSAGSHASTLYQFSCWARLQAEADEVRTQLELALNAADFVAVTQTLTDIYDDEARLSGSILSARIR